MRAHRLICRHPPATDGDRLPADLHPVLRRVLRARHVGTAEELDLSLDRLLPPRQLKGIEAAVHLLAESLRAQRRLLVIADFDADGATACALALRALRAFGAAHVDFLVPNRFEYGYGLTPEIVRLAARQAPDLLITVDNGISSIEGVRAARAAGMQVLVTDHHLPGAELPAADAIVNPNQPGDRFPSKVLAGVGVIFYVMLALRARLRETGWFAEQGIAEPNLAELLDLVALGTVADVVPLDHNNRILVAQGLARIRAGRGGEGIRALTRAAGRDPARLNATDLGFVIAPRLNAAGRIADMSLGIACLLSDEPLKAGEMARQLDALNRERRAIEADMQEQALGAIAALRLNEQGLPRGLCLFDGSWHQGVIGLVAARIKERVHRPVIAFAPSGDTEIKGSARSVPGLHIRDALDNIAARHPALLARFGGHAMAAGLTLARDAYEVFAQAFDEEVGRWLSEDDLQGRLWSDGELAPVDLTLALAELLRDAGPWGQGFPEPLFDGDFAVVSRRVVGERHLKLALRPARGERPMEVADGTSLSRDPRLGAIVDAIAFHAAPDGEAPPWPAVRAAYRLDVNEYQGARSLQLVIEHLEPLAQDASPRTAR
jgi:single-stranded-DNA-specific exonuclease